MPHLKIQEQSDNQVNQSFYSLKKEMVCFQNVAVCQIVTSRKFHINNSAKSHVTPQSKLYIMQSHSCQLSKKA